MLSRWDETWQKLGVSAPAAAYDALAAAYGEPQRKYHTTQHLAECFAFYDSLGVVCGASPLVELAIWFHDVVYDTHALDDQAASAAQATRVLTANGLSAEACLEVSNLILATRHTAVASSPAEKLLLDVDLSILGAETARFEEYEAQVRAEYDWVPEQQFRTARAAILKQFLARPQIFQLPQVQQLREGRARQNLAVSIAQLERV